MSSKSRRKGADDSGSSAKAEKVLGALQESNIVHVSAHGREYIIQQDLKSFNHGLSLWDSSVGLLRYFEHVGLTKDFSPRHSVLELGAGTGFLGMVLASAVGSKVLMTDLPSVLPNMKSTCRANGVHVLEDWDSCRALFGGGDDGAEAAAGAGVKESASTGALSSSAGVMSKEALGILPYSWGDPLAPLLSLAPEGWDHILGTDVLYSPTLVVALLGSMALLALYSQAGPAAMTLEVSKITEEEEEEEGTGKTAAAAGSGAADTEAAPSTPAGASSAAGSPSAVSSTSSSSSSSKWKPKWTKLHVANEVRCEDTHSTFLEISGQLFQRKEISRKKVGPVVAASSVLVFEMRLLPDLQTAGDILQVLEASPWFKKSAVALKWLDKE